jgi:sulfate permease, SulP family
MAAIPESGTLDVHPSAGQRPARLLTFLGFDRSDAKPAILTALVTSFVAVVNCASYPAIIFTGLLGPYLPAGIGISLVSAVVLGTVMALASSYPGSIAYAQSQPLVILALVATPIAASLHAAGHDAQILPTVLAATTVGALGFGGFLLFLGVFRLGNLIRYIPFPMIGGVLAGTGWLMLKAAVASMSGIEIHYDTLLSLLMPGPVERWLPGVVLGVGLRLLQMRRPRAANLPLVLGSATAVFWALAAALGESAAGLQADAWLLGPIPASGVWSPWQHIDALRAADWRVLPHHLVEFTTLAVMSSVALLLTANAIEIGTRRDLDLNRELKYAGIGNILCGLVGGLPGHHALTPSNLTYRMHAPVRVVGLLTALACLLVLLTGARFIAYVPKFVAGALLVEIAFGYLAEWLYRSFRRMGRADFAVLALVFLTVVLGGFMPAVGVGTGAGVALFVVRYSKMGVTRNVLTGASYRSNVDRAQAQQVVLRETGAQIFILRLQGFIFFGTANALVSVVRERMTSPTLAPLRYLVLDFRLVGGMDASAVASFTKLLHYAEDRQFTIVLTHISEAVAARLRKEGISDTRRHIRIFPDLDHGLEWAENELLHEHGSALPGEATSFELQILDLYPHAEDGARFRSYLETIAYGPGDVLIRQGADSDDILFIESGRVAVMLEAPNGSTVRLKSMGPGTVVGEIAFYLNVPRSASVIALEPTTVLRLTSARLRDMQRDDPRIAAEFHVYMAKNLSTKLVETNRLVSALNH